MSLTNVYDGLLPGMYVYASVFIQRPKVYALPAQTTPPQAILVSGNRTYCYLLKDNKAIKTPVQAGISDGTWGEVDKMKINDAWVKVGGNEHVIVGDLSELADGQAVNVAESPGIRAGCSSVVIATHAWGKSTTFNGFTSAGGVSTMSYWWSA